MPGPFSERDQYARLAREEATRVAQSAEWNASRRRSRITVARASLVALGALVAGVALFLVLGHLRIMHLGFTTTGYLHAPPPEARAVLKQFLHAVDIGDVDRAYDLMSTRAKAALSREQLEESIAPGGELRWFRGYKSLTVTQSHRLVHWDINPDYRVHQLTLQGAVDYQSVEGVTLLAVMDLVEGAWKVHGVSLDSPYRDIVDTQADA